MADDLKFTEGGVKLEASIAQKMEELLAASTLALTVGTGVGAVAFVLEVISLMTKDDSVSDALRNLQKQIDGIRSVLIMLDQRLDELINLVAIETNRQTLRDLNDYLDEVRSADLDMQAPSQDLETAIRIANRSGITLDKFVRNDLDIWRWTDVVSAPGATEPSLAPLRFKNVPTLQVYLAATLTWLAAREKVVQMGARARLDDDGGRIARHLGAVSVRPEFDKYADGETGTARSIAENIKWRIRAFPRSSNQHPVNRVCMFFFEMQNWMSGDRKRGDNFDLTVDSDQVLCTVDPQRLGTPKLELDAETAAGAEVMRNLADTLEHVASTGTIRRQFIGQFPTDKFYPPAPFYVVEQNADLVWYSNLESARPGGSTLWQGPSKVGNGWGGFKTVFSGGGRAIYAVQPDGVLLWYGHDGHFDGTATWRPSPLQVGIGWHGFETIFPGGEFVVYGVLPDGTLLWYRHLGAPVGGDINTWTVQQPVGTGWSGFHKVFSGGKGVIYTISLNGVLTRHVHTGYLTGTDAWEGPSQAIGTGWAGFHDVIAAANGVFYAFTRDGRVLWYRYGDRQVAIGGGIHPETGEHFTLFDTITTWEGPVEIKHGFPGFRFAFPRMESAEPFIGPH